MPQEKAMSVIKLKLPENPTDENLREAAHKNKFSGEYTTKICRNCGMFWANPDGNYKTAKIIEFKLNKYP